jgi:hypothetical protein
VGNAFFGHSQPDDDLWLENYFKLEDFKKLYGHANPSQMDKNPEIKKLGKWVNDQRTLKNTGRTNKKGITKFLSVEREVLLTELGVDWQYQLTKRKEELEKFIREYLTFMKIYPNGKPEKGDRRFVWVMQKRNEIKHRYKDENLEDSKWRRDRLRQVGINFW